MKPSRLLILFVLSAALLAISSSAQNLPLVNMSSRSLVQTGQNVTIAGFIISSTAKTTKQVIIRGLGPSLGLPGTLANPTLTLNGPTGVIFNNNWKDTQQTLIEQSGLAPTNDLESAMIQTLPPGAYTVTLAGNGGGTGLGQVEVYDYSGLPSSGSPPIVNMSSRAQIGTGNNVLIGGVIVNDSTRAVIRGMGPSLLGVTGKLQNPMLSVYDSNGTVIASNDNYNTDPNSNEMSQLGLLPGSTLESATIATLATGYYTAIVSGVNNTTGVGQVEFYALDDPTYPRVFQAWANADNLVDPNVTGVAMHDLMWNVEFGFGWNWVNSSGVVDGNYHDEIFAYKNANPQYPIPTIRALNPKIKFLCSIDHYATLGTSLDVNDIWWLHGSDGMRIEVQGYPGNYLLDQNQVSLQSHVAARAAAVMQTGQFDGVMLDSCFTGTTYLADLLSKIRAAIGPDALIIVNGHNDQLSTTEIGNVNGVFMETKTLITAADWQKARTSLDFNEINTLPPHLNCLEDWWTTSRTSTNDLKSMRAVTCLSLTHSNGFALFSDPNTLPTQDHLHNWYNFWSNHSLGVSTGAPTNTWYTNGSPSGYAHRRDFQNGSAIWNKLGNPIITITFSQLRTRVSTGARSMTFSLSGNDGDIFLY